MGKQVKRVLTKPENTIDVPSDGSLSHDPDFDPNQPVQEEEDGQIIDDRSYDDHEPARPSSSRSRSSNRKRPRSNKSRSNKKRKKVRSHREPTDSSDFQSGYSSNYTDEYDVIKFE